MVVSCEIPAWASITNALDQGATVRCLVPLGTMVCDVAQVWDIALCKILS